MQNLIQNFGRDELVQLSLRQLFEQRGFRRIKTGKFEEYALYLENKNFLDTESIITFMDVDGKLLALKPDVTLSIIKNTPPQRLASVQKLYYIDEVYRLASENREYKVHNQIGIELIGEADQYSTMEVIDLALESLKAISERYVLDISHLGFVSGLLAELGISHRKELLLLQNIHTKNTWDIEQLLKQADVPAEKIQQVLKLASLHGGFSDSLARAEQLICNEQMQQAFDELKGLEPILQANGSSKHVNLDFSVVNHLDYYNGLIFRGYVEGVPSRVLTGGRYDNLMKKIGKQSGAIGFAVSLDKLGTYLKNAKHYDYDYLVTYPETCDFPLLLKLTKELCAKGKRLRLEQETSDIASLGFVWEKQLRFYEGALEEVASC